MMPSTLQRRLLEIDIKHRGKRVRQKRLRVFYGWAKINKVRKKEAISVIFENDFVSEARGKRFLNKMQNTVYTRIQTEEEMRDAEMSNRAFTEYSIFMDGKIIQRSLELALRKNSLDDRNNVSTEEREKIASALRERYLLDHPGYTDPVVQLSLDLTE